MFVKAFWNLTILFISINWGLVWPTCTLLPFYFAEHDGNPMAWNSDLIYTWAITNLISDCMYIHVLLLSLANACFKLNILAQHPRNRHFSFSWSETHSYDASWRKFSCNVVFHYIFFLQKVSVLHVDWARILCLCGTHRLKTSVQFHPLQYTLNTPLLQTILLFGRKCSKMPSW